MSDASNCGEGSSYTSTQAALRDAFDELFEGLARFQIFRERGLVEDADVRVHLTYWLEILTGARWAKTQEYRSRLWEFARAYGYERAWALASELGYAVPTSDVATRA